MPVCVCGVGGAGIECLSSVYMIQCDIMSNAIPFFFLHLCSLNCSQNGLEVKDKRY